MVCYLMAPSHYLIQCWLISNEVQWHSFNSNFRGNTSDIDMKAVPKLTQKSSNTFLRGRGQRNFSNLLNFFSFLDFDIDWQPYLLSLNCWVITDGVQRYPVLHCRIFINMNNHDNFSLAFSCPCWHHNPGGRFKNIYKLLNPRALKISMLYKNYIFQCRGKIFCVEFQRVPLKFHTKYLTHTLKDVYFIRRWKF